MRIPSKGRYAINAMLDLAINRNNRPITIADISEKHCISLSYLEQLFSDLRKNGLVTGTRGPGGGYKLAKSIEEIRIADIILAVDKNAVDKDNENEPYLPYIVWSDLSTQIFDFLRNKTLADCLNKSDSKPDVNEDSSSTHGSETSIAAA